MKYVLYVLLQATIKDVFISHYVFILSRLLIIMACKMSLQVFLLPKFKGKEIDNMNNSDITKLKHIEVPTIVLLDEELSSTTKLLLGLINTLSMQEGFCYASNKYLSNLLKVSKRTITSCITSLRTKKYIRVENEPNIRRIYLADFC